MIPPARLLINEDERLSIMNTVGMLANHFVTVEDDRFPREATLASHELPARIRGELLDFKMAEPNGALLIQGLQIADDLIGPTPCGQTRDDADKSTLPFDIAFFLFASALGDPIGWATYQDGTLLQDVAPKKGHELDQTSTGSQTNLEWHTEEAYHPFRPDYVGLMCLRNPDHVATTLTQVDDLDLSPADIAVLRREAYVIRPDEAHLLRRDEITDLEDREESFRRVEAMNSAPDPVALVFGAEDSPYLRIDPYYMDRPSTPETAAAFDKLCAQIEANIQDVALQPGDMLFLDNWRTVHGRKAFQARYDGKDRWLKRLSVTRDLRKSREMRRTTVSRSIG